MSGWEAVSQSVGETWLAGLCVCVFMCVHVYICGRVPTPPIHPPHHHHPHTPPPPPPPHRRLKAAIEEETEVIREIAEEINAGFGARIFPMVASSNHCACCVCVCVCVGGGMGSV